MTGTNKPGATKSLKEGALKEGTLTDRQEKLLMKCFDGEGHALDRFRMQRLLCRCPEAAAFMSALESTKGRISAGSSAPKVELWDRICSRLDQEARAELFLGRRIVAAEKGGWRSNWASNYLTWGFSGAAVTACLALLMFSNGLDSRSGPGTRIASPVGSPGALGKAGVELVAERSKDELPRIIERNYQNSVEVDWMRSDGRVRLMQDPRQKNAVIWVKRRRPAAVPFFGQDEIGGSSRGDRPMILLDKNIPQVTVANNSER